MGDPASHLQVPVTGSMLTQFGILTHPHSSAHTCAAHSHTCTGSDIRVCVCGGVDPRRLLWGSYLLPAYLVS